VVDSLFEVPLPFDASAPQTARSVLRAWGAGAEAAVVVTELVLNAVRHGDPPIALTAIRTQNSVHIEVSDDRPELGEPEFDSIGLRLVEGFASSWGIAPRIGGGKVVWAKVPA
jgi:anti-sigma regulatory factor (Ser/Thr protein kinase)